MSLTFLASSLGQPAGSDEQNGQMAALLPFDASRQ